MSSGMGGGSVAYRGGCTRNFGVWAGYEVMWTDVRRLTDEAAGRVEPLSVRNFGWGDSWPMGCGFG